MDVSVNYDEGVEHTPHPHSSLRPVAPCLLQFCFQLLLRKFLLFLCFQQFFLLLVLFQTINETSHQTDKFFCFCRWFGWRLHDQSESMTDAIVPFSTRENAYPSPQICSHISPSFTLYSVSSKLGPTQPYDLPLQKLKSDDRERAVSEWRCRWELHPRMGVLQTPALLLGYGTNDNQPITWNDLR